MKRKLLIWVLTPLLCFNFVSTCYINAHATESAVAIGSVSSGVGLLGLLAMCGVGMELDNHRKFTELTDDEKDRISTGLVRSFEEVGLQRGASLEKIRSWTSDLCAGILDKSSECWGIFKDWAKNISLSDTSSGNKPIENAQPVSIDTLNGVTFVPTINDDVVITIDNEILDQVSSKVDTNNNYIGYIVTSPTNSSGFYFYIICIRNNSTYPYISKDNGAVVFSFYKVGDKYYCNSGSSTNSLLSYLTPNGQQYIKAISASKPVYYVDNSWNVIIDNKNGFGLVDNSTYFSTNTDYLERLKGQEEDVIDVIDVTDVKNPIIETRPNSIARIDWNRGTGREPNNNDDDDNKYGLVPMNVWYEALDDNMIEQHNAITEYDNSIQNTPEEDRDKVFISTTPINNISNYYNVMPVVNTPVPGTVVNNNYTYNNYYNNNNTIYELPYNSELVPYIPTMIFQNKFPFCIPWDIYDFVAMFYTEREAPQITIPFPYMTQYNGVPTLVTQDITLSLADYEYLSLVLRVMFFIAFLVGLALITRQLIKG